MVPSGKAFSQLWLYKSFEAPKNFGFSLNANDRILFHSVLKKEKRRNATNAMRG